MYFPSDESGVRPNSVDRMKSSERMVQISCNILLKNRKNHCTISEKKDNPDISIKYVSTYGDYCLQNQVGFSFTRDNRNSLLSEKSSWTDCRKYEGIKPRITIRSCSNPLKNQT